VSDAVMRTWPLREAPQELARHYVDRGWWTEESLGTMVHSRLRPMRDTPFAVHSSVRPWRGTIGEVERSARSFASWLVERGIRAGDAVVLQLPNWVEAAIAFWGAAYAGAVVVPVVHFYGAKELGHILRVTEPALLVTPDRFGQIDYLMSLATTVDAAGTPWAVVGNTLAHDLPNGAMRFGEFTDHAPLDMPVAAHPDSPAVIAFTSGTTRDPKGVIHSHRTIGFEARQSAVLSPTDGPPPITGAPVGHFIGMLSAFLASLIRGVPINLIDVWDPGRVLGLMLDEGIGMTGGATYFLTSLIDHPDFTDEHLKHMPYAGLGGSPVPIAVTQRLAALGIKVMRCYGSTEHPTITGCQFDEPEDKRLATDGHGLLGVEIKLDADGQILSRGPDLFVGYTDPALTSNAFDDDGWYRTGDVGVLDGDGFLAITDRISDVIIRGGENISAQEVEELLVELPIVAEAAVVAESDPRLGERAVAIVRSRDGRTGPSLEAVQEHLSTRGLAKQKWPESIRTVADFPRTASGKVQKFRLREQLRAGELEFEIAHP
jgi:acyl-CoA synthetase (AMP-forming)/AMP-acid ligase II